MPNVTILKEKIKDSGMKVNAVAIKSGIDRATLYNRMRNPENFKASEIVGLVSVLNLSEDEREKIFFSLK